MSTKPGSQRIASVRHGSIVVLALDCHNVVCIVVEQLSFFRRRWVSFQISKKAVEGEMFSAVFLHLHQSAGHSV